MEIDEQLEWYLSHLERLAPALLDADASDMQRAAPSLAEEYGFVRRYLDGFEDLSDERVDALPLPEEASARLQSVERHFRNVGLRDILPTPDELAESMHRLVEESVRLQIGDGMTPQAPEEHPSPTAERAEPARRLRDDADQLLSVARTLQTLGANTPSTLFGQSIQLAKRLRVALDEKVLGFFVGDTRDTSVERLADVEPFGRFLWGALVSPEMQPDLMRQIAS
jgi:hypothetical protein